jgi:negative regulator of flagellin synthesis FlgM
VADAARTGGPGAADATRASAEGGSERVSLTDDARRAAELERTMEREFFVDEGRIDAIRSAIRNGEYSIDPQRIADKLLQLEQGL